MSATFILGGHQSDFARNFRKEGRSIGDLIGEVALATLAQCGVGPEAVETIHVGNAFGQLYTGQGHLGAMPATMVPGSGARPRWRTRAPARPARSRRSPRWPSSRPGVTTARSCSAPRSSGRCPARRPRPCRRRPRTSGTRPRPPVSSGPPRSPSIADAYGERYGLDDRHLRAIGRLNLENAKANPNAQTRALVVRRGRASPTTTRTNPVVAGRLRRNDCCQITDGGAGDRARLGALAAREPRGRAARADRRLGAPHGRPLARRRSSSVPGRRPT